MSGGEKKKQKVNLFNFAKKGKKKGENRRTFDNPGETGSARDLDSVVCSINPGDRDVLLLLLYTEIYIYIQKVYMVANLINQ